MKLIDFMALIHPVLAIVVVFPLLGMAVNLAWQTRQRRLQTADGKSKISPIVGPEHVKLGRWLTGSVVGITLIAIAYSIGKNVLSKQLWVEQPQQVALIGLLFVATSASLVCLYPAHQWFWRAIFATLTGMGLVVLGCQEGVFRRGYEWYVSHYYSGIAAALLMIFSLAILQDIYRNRHWRTVHVLLNCLALFLFVAQGMTGTRDLLEIPLSWQTPHLYQCDFTNLTCPSPAPPPNQ